MKRIITLSFLIIPFILVGFGETKTKRPQNAHSSVPLVSWSQAAPDTFVLGDWDFQTGAGLPDAQGWVGADLTAQIKWFFHVDGSGGAMNGGTLGNLVPLAGTKSMWCGEPASTVVPFCGYPSLPGYGNDWHQILLSDPESGDSLTFEYDVFWDSEPGLDGTVVQYSFDGGATWDDFPITDSLSTQPGVYDGIGIPSPGLHESFTVTGPGGVDNILIRFRFRSNGTQSDEDGLWPTDGAIIVDNLAVAYFDSDTLVSSDLEDFEGATLGATSVGIWTGTSGPSFGGFAALYPGITVVQEDPCRTVFDYLWGFFDNPASTNYSCGGWPAQGAMPFGTADGIYMKNEIWSPVISKTGSGFDYRLGFDVYKDLPLDNLQFFTWRVRTWTDGCPSLWRDHDFVYYGKHRFWGTAFTEELDIPGGGGNPRFIESIGDLIDPSASSIQIAIGAVDMCAEWCDSLGTGACHSHAPLIDNVRLERIGIICPQFRVRNLDLFQDNFAADGTLSGTARADAAIDILPVSSPNIRPGDSVAVHVAPVGTDPQTGTGPAAYCYVAVVPNSQTGKTPADMEAPEARAGVGTRWPLVGTQVESGLTWAQFRMDSVIGAGMRAKVPDRYCIDLNDNVFTPGDTIFYFFGADDGSGNVCYWTRSVGGQARALVTTDIDEAFSSPCEFTILPAGGYNRGGDILFVDDSDDRGGPPQLFFDSALDLIGMRDLVDRYDVLAPTSFAGNSLESRVTNIQTQIVDVYQKIIWCTGNLESGLIGDGTGDPEKSDDFGLLFTFLDTSTRSPGLYLSGSNIAQEWAGLAGAGASNLKSTYIDHELRAPSHIDHGEQVSPQLNATASGAFGGDSLVVYGGCPIINDFDVLTPKGASIIQVPWPNKGDGAVISASVPNSVGDTATVVLSGFSFNYIRDLDADGKPERAEHLRDILVFLGNAPGPVTGIGGGEGPLLANYLDNNYPNPFNPTTTIRYGIKERAHVSLQVYNVAGQLVRTLVNGVKAPAVEYKVPWDGDNNRGQSVASGVYFYKLVTKNFTKTKKMVLLK